MCIFLEEEREKIRIFTSCIQMLNALKKESNSHKNYL